MLDLTDPPSRDKFFVAALNQCDTEIFFFSYATANGEYYGAYRNGNGVIEILKDNGFDMDVLTLEWPYDGFREFARRIRKLAGNRNIFEIVKAVKNATQVAKRVDELEMLTFRLRPRETEKGGVDKIYRSFREKALKAEGFQGITALLDETEEALHAIPLDKEARPLKIGIVGEIYTGIEHFASFSIQERLGAMGVEADRKVTVSNWIIEHIVKKGLHLPRDMAYAEAARPWLRTMIGGHAQETVGNTVLYAKNHYDGIIQIFPFSCMPEIVAESLLPCIERELGIPILTLIIDEMTGEAGYITRVEAFIDMLERRRELGQNEPEQNETGSNEDGWVLSWN
jgi:predicted nucleotide-binding protein (sugar kinase/HSP70/actin superfamily)